TVERRVRRSGELRPHSGRLGWWLAGGLAFMAAALLLARGAGFVGTGGAVGHNGLGEPVEILGGGTAIDPVPPEGAGLRAPPRRRPAVPKLHHRRLQQRAPLRGPARRSGRVRTARCLAQRRGGAHVLTARPISDSLDPQLLTRARGALLGLVVGNQLAVPTERL